MISVCMATYNGERYIKEQIQSILPQLQPTDELIVSDDESTDSTLEIIESFHDKRIKIYHSTAHHFKWNFYNALIHAKGDYIFLSDQDDVWLPNKVNRCVEVLQNYDLVVHDCKIVDENLQTVYPSFFTLYHSGSGLIKNVIRSNYYGCCMAFRRRVFEDAIPFPKTDEIFHDIWLGLVAETIGKVYFLHEPLISYRRHTNTKTHLYTSLFSKHGRPYYKKILSRFTLLCAVLYFKIYNFIHSWKTIS